MSRIETLHIHNFKFFDEQKPIKLGGKHLLLFGENGSGKSSVYWSLYTLFEASVKYDVEQIKKYFKDATNHEETLINIYASKITEADSTEHYNSFIKVVTTDTPPVNYEVSLLNTAISTNANAVEVNQASDFINYKVLYKFQDFWNGEPIDLANIFAGYILPYIKFSSYDIWREGTLQPRTNAIEMWEEIKIGPGTFKKDNDDVIQVYKSSKENTQFERFTKHFDDSFLDLIDFINQNAPTMLKQLGYDIDFELKYHPHTHKKGDSKYTFEPFKIDFKITSYLGKKVSIHRPQSFLNEAKITAIAIAIRLTVLRKRINEEAKDVLKFIVFDDVMISLDMNNRDKLIDFILNPANKFTADYQLLFLTHDKNLFDFVANKIKQWDKIDNWVYKEMYAGKVEATKKEYPIIIDSDLEYIDKAQKYYDAKDYTACSIYIRKELEKIVNQRLPPVLKEKVDGSFLSLQTLWGNMLKRYTDLGKPVAPNLTKIFDETKLMVLNPQAHFQDISLPIYKVELEKAFFLIKELKDKYPIPIYTIVLAKGMKLQFKHPAEDYTFDFELLSNFNLIGLDGTVSNDFPKCKITNWKYKGTDFFSPGLNKVIDGSKVQKRDDELDKLLANLKNDTVLNITSEMFINNTSIDNCLWSFKEILDKSKINF